MRVLYLVHGHEQFSVGGAENAAFALFRESQKYAEIESWIIAAVHTSKGVLAHGELRSVEGTDREYLIGTSCEWFRFTNANISSMRRSLKRLLDHIKPEIIHLQHYINFGIDVIPLLQSICPQAKIVVTLHEYLALCMHNGQMVTKGQLKLCEKATPLACSICFPEHSGSSLFLRHHYIKTILESSDALVSPSQFLIQRYRDCEIDHENFRMIENGLPNYFNLEERSSYFKTYSETLNRFAYFGQLNQYKGVLLLLKAAQLLQQANAKDFVLNIYGANLEGQPADFQAEFKRLHDKVSDFVFLRGSYRQTELKALMLENDWSIVPSIWWENSPVVIQESFFYGRPVIGSDIGGTAEKAQGRGGLIFTARSEVSLATQIEMAIKNSALHQVLRSEIGEPFTARACFQSHFLLYGELISLASKNFD
jgi:glycosyltransferase involved in cell wall biosynthesis